MNTRSLLLLLLAVLVALPIAAQGAPDPLSLSRDSIAANRQALVAAGMPITGKQAAEFWPMYKDYRAEVDKLGERKVGLLSTFAGKYDTLDDEIAKSLIDESFKVKKDELEIKLKWSRKFARVLSPKQEARLFQLENKLDAVVDAELAEEVPLSAN